MQAEVLAALIGVPGVVVTAALSYAVGRHQARATQDAAKHQAAAQNLQWRGADRKAAWSSFLKAADQVYSAAADRFDGKSTEDPSEVESFIALSSCLADVEFEGHEPVVDAAKSLHGACFSLLAYAAILGPFRSAQREFDRRYAEEAAEIARSVIRQDRIPSQMTEAQRALSSLTANGDQLLAATPSRQVMAVARATFLPRVAAVDERFRSAFSAMYESLSAPLLTAYVSNRDLMEEVRHKLRQCEFTEDQATGLMTNALLGGKYALSSQYDSAREEFMIARSRFLEAMSEHLGGA